MKDNYGCSHDSELLEMITRLANCLESAADIIVSECDFEESDDADTREVIAEARDLVKEYSPGNPQ